jgi:hypothetical protein
MAKTKKYSEEGVNLASKVPQVVADKFRKQAQERGQKVKTNLAAAAKLWIQLSEEAQAKLLNQTTDSGSFTELVRQIADEQIHKALKKKNSK